MKISYKIRAGQNLFSNGVMKTAAPVVTNPLLLKRSL